MVLLTISSTVQTIFTAIRNHGFAEKNNQRLPLGSDSNNHVYFLLFVRTTVLYDSVIRLLKDQTLSFLVTFFFKDKGKVFPVLN